MKLFFKYTTIGYYHNTYFIPGSQTIYIFFNNRFPGYFSNSRVLFAQLFC